MIIAVVGPTGVGKTKMSIELAKKYNAIVVNSDSMQIYKELNIGTAKIKESEKENIPHYLFDIKNIEENYTAFDYQKDLRKLIEENKNKNIILVGGSGLYLKAGLFNYEFSIEKEHNDFENYSNESLYQLALKKDKNIDIHPNNRKRLVRFLNKSGDNTNKGDELLYDTLFIGLTTTRDTLYKRINKRVDLMIEEGLIDEVKSFYDRKIKSKAIMTGIGYKEIYDYFDNKINLEEAIELIKKRSRNYAKRQYTWFNNKMNVTWFNVDFNNFDNTINEVISFIENKKS